MGGRCGGGGVEVLSIPSYARSRQGYDTHPDPPAGQLSKLLLVTRGQCRNKLSESWESPQIPSSFVFVLLHWGGWPLFVRGVSRPPPHAGLEGSLISA